MPWGVLAALVIGLVGCETAGPQPTLEPPVSSVPVTQAAAASQRVAASSPAVALDDLLPNSLNGVELHTFPVGGDLIERLASTLGIEPNAIAAAYASEHGARFFQTYALRVAGVDGGRLLDAFLASAYDPREGEVARDEATVGGRSVSVVTQPETAARLGTFYVLLVDDVLLAVQSFDPVVADEVIAALP
ncbi:MAG: hypothetical protein ACRDG7_08020 [Candidatus Limnocylindria bacterium]